MTAFNLAPMEMRLSDLGIGMIGDVYILSTDGRELPKISSKEDVDLPKV